MSELYDDLDELPPRPRKSIPAADRELLELAARAIGAVRVDDVEGEEWLILHFADGTVTHGWNPLLFYGDTFELQVRLRLQVTPGTYLNDTATAYAPDGVEAKEHIHYQQDMLTATSRAIVRAAAEIGNNVVKNS